MSKAIILEVKKCTECTHRCVINGEFSCSLTSKRITIREIPSWCPLPAFNRKMEYIIKNFNQITDVGFKVEIPKPIERINLDFIIMEEAHGNI